MSVTLGDASGLEAGSTRLRFHLTNAERLPSMRAYRVPAESLLN